MAASGNAEYVAGPRAKSCQICSASGQCCTMDSGQCKEMFLPKRVFSRYSFLPFCCCISHVSANCKAVNVNAVTAQKSVPICSNSVDQVNVYSSNSAETGTSCWVWKECRITVKGQCHSKVFTKTWYLAFLCI